LYTDYKLFNFFDFFTYYLLEMSDPPFESIGDIETLVIAIVLNSGKRKLLLETGEYTPAVPDDSDMLNWSDPRKGIKNAEIQDLVLSGFARVGTIGDGNCMLHSFLYALSPTYRAHNRAARAYIADRFRDVLVSRIDELKFIADIIYFDAGGADAAEEWFTILTGSREELNIEMGSLIAKMYNVNFLAIQILDDMSLKPVCISLMGYDATLPIVLVNYLGGGTDVGNKNFLPDGHYEAILMPVYAAASSPVSPGATAATTSTNSKRRTTRKKSPKTVMPSIPVVRLDEVRTRYFFDKDDIKPILELFRASCGAMLKPIKSSQTSKSPKSSNKARAGAGTP
jgi:hypothetical protein